MNFPAHRPLEDTKCEMLVWLAALTVEQERWGLDEMDAESFAYLRDATSVACKNIDGSDESWDIASVEKDDWLSDYRLRLGAHREAGVAKAEIGRRMDRVTWAFKLWGYNPHYAGYEDHFRRRLCRLLDTGKFEDVDDLLWNEERIQTEAATYMAYTDYYDTELRRRGV
jgi:hypothetical protein